MKQKTSIEQELDNSPWSKFCRVWIQKGNRLLKQHLRNEMDGPCLKLIMVSKPEIHFTTLNVLGHILYLSVFIM